MSEARITYQEQAPSPYAGFWRRVGASLIDSLIILVPYFLLAMVFWPPSYVSGGVFHYSAIFYLASAIITWAYRVGFESSVYQATLGKQALGIVVTDLEGRVITWETATMRSWVYWLMSLLAIVDLIFGSWKMLSGIGFFVLIGIIAGTVSCVMVAFTARNQGWHDMMAGCLVVRKGAMFEQKQSAEPSPGERFLNR